METFSFFFFKVVPVYQKVIYCSLKFYKVQHFVRGICFGSKPLICFVKLSLFRRCFVVLVLGLHTLRSLTTKTQSLSYVYSVAHTSSDITHLILCSPSFSDRHFKHFQKGTNFYTNLHS